MTIRHKNKRKTVEYAAWCGIMARCGVWSTSGRDGYVNKGITVCKEWRGDLGFERFLEHIGQQPLPGLEVDRIDNNKGYQPGNVRWASDTINSGNKSNNVMVTYNGETLCLNQMAKKYGKYGSTVRKRLKDGLSIEEALTR